MEQSTQLQPPITAGTNGEVNMIQNRIDSFSDLDISNYDWNCHVRAQSIWKGINKQTQEFYGINVVFIDDANSRIHAFINKKICSMVDQHLAEGQVYLLSNFRVKQYVGDETNRPVRNPKHIYFTEFTKLEKILQPCLPIEKYAFDFHSLSEIEKIVQDNRFLIDMVGIVTNRRPLIAEVKDGKEKFRLKFDITDGKSIVRVTFFNDLAKDCDNALILNDKCTKVIAIACGKVGRYNEKTYISNFPATRFYMNPTHYCVKQVKDRYEKWSTVDVSSPEDEGNHPKLNVKQISELGEEFIQKEVCCDIILKKVDEKAGWFYNKCTHCVLEVEKNGNKFQCPKTKRIIPYPDRRFRIFTIGADPSGSMVIVIPDSEVRQLTGKTVLDLLGDDDDDVEVVPLPDLLKELKNKHYTVTILLTKDNIKNGSTVYNATQLVHGKDISGSNSTVQETQMQSNHPSMLNETLGGEITSTTPHTGKSTNKVRPRETTVPVPYNDEAEDAARVLKIVKKEHV